MNLVISKREGTDYYEITGHEGRHRMAADIEIVGIDNKVLAEYIQDNFKFTQLI